MQKPLLKTVRDASVRKEALADYEVFGCVRVMAFGRDSFEQEADWTLRHLQEDADGRKDMLLTRHLPAIARELGVSQFVAPSPVEFNAHICHQKMLRTLIQVGAHGPVVCRGYKADGCRIERGQGFLASLAGCAYLLLRDASTDICVVAHTGVKSVINYWPIEARVGLPQELRRATKRDFESVIESAVRAFQYRHTAQMANLEAAILFPITAEELVYPWDEPRYGALNKAVCEHVRDQWGVSALPGWKTEPEVGRIDLAQLLYLQLASAGVPRVQIYPAPTNFGRERWYTTRGKFPARRNLIAIAHQ